MEENKNKFEIAALHIKREVEICNSKIKQLELKIETLNEVLNMFEIVDKNTK